jgi:hypothetical protein
MQDPVLKNGFTAKERITAICPFCGEKHEIREGTTVKWLKCCKQILNSEK